MISKISNLYFRYLPYSLCATTGIGIGNSISNEKIDIFRMSSNVSIGVFAGIIYPISIPIYLYAKIKNLN